MIYCVEDDKNIRDLVVYALNTSGLSGSGFADAERFFAALEKRLPALILLDIMLPGEDGMAILARLKQNRETANIPVIMLTAKGAEYDKVQGLDQGADDYVTKPFGVMELLSRIKAVMRRSAPKDEQNVITVGPLVLNCERHEVYSGQEEIILTYKEFELLRYLMENQGIVLTRDKILKAVWGYDYEGETRTVDVHIGTLRQKIGEAAHLIETVRGIGYRIGGEK